MPIFLPQTYVAPKPSPSTLQWQRECEVLIGKATAGQGLVVKDLRITFEITKTITSKPNTALVKIYNLNQANEGKIKGEYDEVMVNAGYAARSLLIFAGNIRHTSRYRDENDSILEIDAADGDFDLRNTIINTALAADLDDGHVLDKVLKDMKRTKKGRIVLKRSENGAKSIRGRVFSGFAKDVLNKIAAQNDAHWSIQDGALQMVNVQAVLPDEAIVVRSDTGMLGAPELDDKGIKVTTLLNPQVRINGTIKLDNNDLRQKVLVGHKVTATSKGQVKHTTTVAQTDADAGEVVVPTHTGGGGAHGNQQKKKAHVPKKLAHLDPDGLYKVYKLVHKGDNRGDDWTTEIYCVGLSEPVPKGVT